MAVTSGMFLFEVVVEKVNSLVSSRHLVIKSDFADIFSLELKDPKQMHIVMPEPPPLPPEPPGKKGKKKKASKPKKGKKGKKGAVEVPPPEPTIQSGQSVLFSSTAEFLIQNMKKFPLEVSLWSKEDNLVFIGSVAIPWDPIFELYLKKIINLQNPPPPTLKDDYNIFEEDTAKMMAKIAMQVKLTFLTEKVTTAFRTLSEDPSIRKCLYTGINSKTTSFMCTMKTTDEDFEENCNKIENNFITDKPTAKQNKIIYADYKNAPGANLTFFNEGDYCCMDHADKPPKSKYKSPETCPDIDHIIDYVRKIIVSCNDNMRMLTPRPTISPRIKATDIDRLCYCKETEWPKSEFAERFKKEVQSGPCPICIESGKKAVGSRGATFDIANIRGPCGRADCKIARDLRAYIEKLVEEDNIEFDIRDLIGPCGSKDCTLAEKIQEFLRHEGEFKCGDTLEGLSTQCACLQKMQNVLTKRESCASLCSKDCEQTGSQASLCGGPSCPYDKSIKKRVYDVYYFTVEHDFDKKPSPSETATPATVPLSDSTEKEKASSSKYKYCPSTCPSMKASEKTFCSKTTCSISIDNKYDKSKDDSKCVSPECPDKYAYPPSPADSNIILDFSEISNPCCVKSCDIAERVKDFIADSIVSKKDKIKSIEMDDADDPCYCDCVCTFKFSNKTTYCAVCGGYECMGNDTLDLPDHLKPHPCPIYHKLYNKDHIKVKSPWPDQEKATKENIAKTGSKEKNITSAKASKTGMPGKESPRKEDKLEKAKKTKQDKKKIGKFTANEIEEVIPVQKKLPETKYPYPPVPKHMGWNWTADDIPGLKPRPKWRPGASHKLLVRKYRALREGTDTIAKKKRALMQRKKKIEMKPTLVVTKKDGEYTVQMEVFKKYSKERLVYQYPYDEKPPLLYIIGKTEAEKNKLQKQRERRIRRETRRKSRLLQSTFRDKCQEICVKAYNQAIGVLPLPNPNDPECPCYTNPYPDISPPIDSCSCSDEDSISSSDTDNDEWVIEFTPPSARWDTKAKHPPVLTDFETQYNYLDYRVKLLDKSGNPIPRFFKKLDGVTECSDLGGFWGPNKMWLEINKDGYIGPDGRWIPMNFTGPDGMLYSAEEGSFIDTSGQLLKIGIDGYIDKDLKWVWYPNKKVSKSGISSELPSPKKVSSPIESNVKGKTKQKSKDTTLPPSASSPSSLKVKSRHKKEIQTEEAKILKKFSLKINNPVVMNVSVDNDRNKLTQFRNGRKPNVVRKKVEKYSEIMKRLQIFNDIDAIKPIVKTNKASNTTKKKPYQKPTQGVTKLNRSAGVMAYQKPTQGLSKLNRSAGVLTHQNPNQGNAKRSAKRNRSALVMPYNVPPLKPRRASPNCPNFEPLDTQEICCLD